MGRVIAIGAIVVILVVVIGLFINWYLKRQERREDKALGRPLKGDLGRKQELELIKENDEAAQYVRKILAPPNSLDEEFVLLPTKMRTELQQWLRSHENRKGLR